jgi:hypothetical protein
MTARSHSGSACATRRQPKLSQLQHACAAAALACSRSFRSRRRARVCARSCSCSCAAGESTGLRHPDGSGRRGPRAERRDIDRSTLPKKVYTSRSRTRTLCTEACGGTSANICMSTDHSQLCALAACACIWVYARAPRAPPLASCAHALHACNMRSSSRSRALLVRGRGGGPWHTPRTSDRKSSRRGIRAIATPVRVRFETFRCDASTSATVHARSRRCLGNWVPPDLTIDRSIAACAARARAKEARV